MVFDSAVFRHMLSQTPASPTVTQTNDARPPLAMDASPESVRLFLDLMTSSTDVDTAANDADTLVKTIELIEKFDAPVIRKLLLQQLLGRVDCAPWKMFCLASHLNEVPLAKASVTAFSDSTFGRGVSNGFDYSLLQGQECGLRFLLALFRDTNMVREMKPRTRFEFIEYNTDLWVEVSNRFEPVRE